MKLLVAILAVLALVGSAMAWDLADNLQYSYTKTAYQQAGDDLILPAFQDATSHAQFIDPGAGSVPASGAEVSNTVGAITVDRQIFYPATDLSGADLTMKLTQGGAANVALHSMINDEAAAQAYALFGKIDTPEMMGSANAYQNLNIAGGFDKATMSFDSAAAVGVDSIWANTVVVPTAIAKGPNSYGDGIHATSAYVDSETMGGGTIETANLGVQVHSDIAKSYDGTGWDTPTYSGGIKMWADFTACDPLCSNPVEAGVSGTSWTSIFPGNYPASNYGGSTYWDNIVPGTGTWQNTNPMVP